MIFLFDSSDSYRSNHFQQESRFAKAVSNKLWNSSVQIGLYTFGKNTFRQFGLKDCHDLSEIHQQLDYLWYSTGDGTLGPALNFTIQDGFTEADGDRECTPNVLVILTHTAVSDNSTRQNLSQLLDKRIIRVFILSMVNGGQTDSLTDLSRDRSRVINVTSFDDLQTKVDTIVNKITTGISLNFDLLPTTYRNSLVQQVASEPELKPIGFVLVAQHITIEPFSFAKLYATWIIAYNTKYARNCIPI